MSKSLQKGILFAVCILLVCALGVTLFLADGTGMVPSVQEGQASAVARNTATYTHGSNIGRPLPSDYTSVSDGTKLKAAIEANNKDIVLTNDVTLQTIDAFWANNYLWNDNSQCFDSDGNGNTNLKVTGFTHKIYGQGYTIEVQGPHAATGQGMQQNSTDTNDYGGLFPKLGNNGAVYDAKIYITKGFSGQTQETFSGTLSSNDEWLNVGGIAGSLIGNAVIDNVTVEIASGVKLASYKWSDGSRTSQYVRVGAIAGEINNTASISNVTVINNGRLESGQYTSQAQFYPDSDRYYGAAGNVVGWISNATTSINNVRVEGSGTLYSYYVANIANAIGSTAAVNNFYNNFTGTFDAKDKYSNTLGKGEGATSTLTVTNHYKKGALASTAGTDNTVRATNTLTVPNNLTLYFIPDATQDSERLGIAFSGTTYSSANDYTVTGLNNAEKTASGGFSAAPSGGTLALGLPVGANNWKTDGTFASITATPKFNPSSYAKLTKYDHGYVAHETTNSGTKITQDNFASYFQPGGQANNQSGTYYLTEDVVVTGFTGINFSGTLDGNGHTIFITGANTGMTGQHIGGIVGTLTGTIKNVRVVLVNSVTANTSVSNANVGLVAGHINGGSLINVSVDIPADVTLKHTDSGNDSSLGGIAGSAVSGATFTNVTMNFNGTLSNIKTSGAGGGYWPFTSAFVGKPSVSQGTNSPANSATFNNIIIRGNGTFASQSSADDEPPYYAAIGIIQHKGVTNSTAAVYNVNGLIYDFNPQFADNQGATSGNHGACYGLFVNNNNNNPGQVQYYDSLVNYGSNGVYNASGKVIEAYAFNEKGNAPVPNPDNIKNITETVTGVTGSTVKAYFMPGDSASENLTLVASASNWNGVTQLQLDGADPAVTSSDDSSNKVVNVAKTTAVSISGENLTLSPYNPYTVITASLVTDTKVYDGTAFEAQVSFAVGGSPLEGLTAGDDYNITYTDGGNTGETNANASGGTYSLTVTLTGTASDGTQYVFDDQGTKTKTFTYTITPLEVTGTWSVNGLEITYGDSDSTLDASHIVINLTDDSIPGGLTERYIVAKGFNSDYVQGTTQAGETVTISEVDFDITEDNGIIADNYTLNITAGAETTVEVQKREITISAADSDLAVGHIVAIYGGTNYVTSQADLQNLLTWANVSDYVENVYSTDEIGFTITAVAHEQTGEEATYAPGEAVQEGEWAKLPAKETYYITVMSANNNYTVAADNYFKYQVTPAELSVTGVVWDDTALDTITYDGNEHTATLQVDGLVGDDTYDSALTVSLTFNSEAVENGVNAGTYTVNVNVNEDDKYYDLGLTGDSDELTLTISPITLTISDKSGVYTDFVAADIVIEDMVSGILEGDSAGVTIDVVWGTTPADENGYLAAGTYNATLSLSGDKSANYTFGSDNIATVAVDQFDLTKAHITITSEQFTYDRTEKTVEYTVLTAEGGKDITALLTAEGDKQTNANAKYTVTLSGDDNFTGTAAADWSIDQKTLTVSPYEADFLDYDSLDSLYTHLTNKDSDLITGVIDGDTITFSGMWATAPTTALGTSYVAAGSYVLNMYASGNDNYKFENNAMSVTINALDISGAVVTWNESLTYTATEQSVSLASVTVKGVALPVEWFNLTNNTGTDANTYTANIAASNSNITGSTDKEFTIAPASVTVTWKIGDIIQGTDPDKVKATAEVTNNGGILDGDEYTFTVTLPLKDGSGDYTTTTPEGTVINVTPSLTFTDSTDAGNYDITYSPEILEWTVQQPEVAISVTKPTVEKTYAKGFATEDEFLSNFTGTFTATDAKADLTSANFDITITKDGADGTTVGVGRLDVGTYTVAISAAAGSQYMIADGSTFTYTYTVTAEQWTATVAAPEGGLTYNGLDQFISLVITPGEANNTCDGAPTIAAVVTGGEMKNAGTYNVTLQLQTADGAYTGGNFVLTADSAQIEIAKLKVKIEWEANGDLVYNGQAHTLTATITNKVETDNVTAIVEKHSGDNINVAEGGFSYTITGLENNDLGNYTFEGVSNITSQAFNIIPATLTVAEKEGATLTRPYDGAPTDVNSFLTETYVTITGGVSGENIYGMLNAEIADGGEIKNAGVYTVTVTFDAEAAGAGNYSVGDFTLLEIVYEVTAKTITITFDGYEGLTYNGQAHTLTATADFVSGESIDLNSLIAYTGDVTNGEAVNAGSYTATITKAQIVEQNANYTLATESVTQEFTISRATLTLTQTAGATLTRPYDGAPTDVNSFLTETYVTITGGVSGENIYGMLNAEIADGGEIKNAGVYTVTVTFDAEAAGAGNYSVGDFTLLEIVYEVTAKTITITFDGYEGLTYNGQAHTLTATADFVSGESIDLNSLIAYTGDVTNGEAINAGSYTATVSKTAVEGAYDNYTLASDATQKFTIAQATLTLTEKEGATLNRDYDGNTTAANSFLTADFLTVTGNAPSDDIYAMLNATVAAEKTILNADTYTVTITFNAQAVGASNYNGADINVSLAYTVNRKVITVTFGGHENLTYTASAHQITATVQGFVNDEATDITDLVVISGNSATEGEAINAGSYTATVSKTAVEGAYDNYTLASDATQKFTIAQATLTLTEKEGATLNRDYDGNTTAANSFLTADFLTVTGNAPSDNIYAMLNATVAAEKTILNADTYTVTITFNAQAVGASNYNGADINVSLAYTVNRKVITVTFGGHENLTYTASAHQITATVKDSINDDVTNLTKLVVISGEGDSALNAGSYTATVSKTAVEGEYPNYTLADDATQEFTIAQATLTLTEKEGATLSRKYDGTTTDASTFVSDAYVTVGGFVDDGSVYDLLTATVAENKTIKNADTYTITFALTNADGNYTLAAFDGITFEVAAKELTAVDVKWTAPADNTYSGSAIAPTAAWASGAIVTGDTVNITITISAQDGSEITDNQAINAGSYTAAATIAAGDASRNYKLVADVTHNFTIARKAVTITWTDGGEGNFVYTYDGTAKAPTASVTEGAVDPDTFADIDNLATIEGALTDEKAINAGSYTARITQAAFEEAYDNYTIERDSERQFTIDPATISVSLSASGGEGVSGNTITLNVSGRVTATAFESGTATLTTGDVTITITATAEGSVELPAMFLTLNGALYTGTAYGTKVDGDTLSALSQNTNYELSVTQTLTLNITPSIVVKVNEGAPRTATYGVSESYKTDYFTSYFSVVDNAGSPVTGGSGEVTITNEEGGSVVQIKNAGTYTITYTYTPADWSGSDEDKPSTSYTFEITPGTIDRVETNGYSSLAYGTLNVNESVNIKVYYTDGTSKDLQAAFTADASLTSGYVNAGNSVTLTLGSAADEDPNYESVAGQTITDLYIAKKDITAEIFYAETEAVEGVLTLPYNGSEGYVISARPVDVLDGDGVDVTVETEITNAATYSNLSLVLGGNDAANYNLTGTDILSVVVNPVQAEVNWTVGEYTYNGSAQQPEASATGVNEDVALNITITGSNATDGAAINAGSYTATASTTNTNYTLTNTTCEFTIGKANVSLSIAEYDNIKNKVYDGNAVTITPNAVFAGTQTEATGAAALVQVLITDITDYNNPVTADAVKNAGAYTVELRLTEEGENINFAYASAYFTFTVTKAELDVTTTALAFSYGDIVDLGASVTALGDDVVTVEIESIVKQGEPAESIDDFTNADRGNYTVTFALAGEGAGNYAISEATATAEVHINPKTITSITWETDATFTYNGSAQMPGYTVDGIEGLNLDERVVITFGEEEVESAINAGDYTVTIKAFDDGGNYVLKQDSFTDFTIARRQVEITWTDETFTYNGTAQAPTFEVNWVQGDEFELTAAITGNVTDGKAINAGAYTATIAAFTRGNYTLAVASTKTFTIDKANITLTPASVTFPEKDAGSLAAYSQSSYEATIKETINVTGVAGKIADYTVTTDATFDGTTGYLVTGGENAGTYTFTITAGDNYNTATFTVTVTAQQTITITATPSSGTYTGSEITFEYEPSDSSVDISGLTITVATVNGSADGAVLNAGSYTVTFNVSNSDEADYLYVVSDWTGTIAAAEVTVTEATLSAIYGEVYTAEATGVAVQNVNGWSVATFNGAPVQATVAIDQTAAAAALPGETIYLRASETAYNVIITLTSDNFKFADTVSVSGNSKQMATTLTVEKKELDVTTPTDLESLTYTSEGVVIEIADISEDIVGSDNVTVTIMVDGELYEPGVTVLSAGEHTITYAISGNGNYAISADSAVGQTFTIAPKAASDSITVSGETVESGGTVEITTGENLRVDTAINNYIAQNGVAEGEYTVTATDSQGNEVDIDRVSSWAPGDYTISVNLGENFSGGEMTFTISVAEGTTTEIPDPPTTPSTPIVDDGGSGNNWLFPLIIAIECVIALALIAAIVITAIKRSKNA